MCSKAENRTRTECIAPGFRSSKLPPPERAAVKSVLANKGYGNVTATFQQCWGKNAKDALCASSVDVLTHSHNKCDSRYRAGEYVMHRLILLLIDLALIALATVGALILRDNLEFSSERLVALLPYLGLTVLVAAPVLSVAGLDRSIWRLSAMPDYTRVLAAVGITVIAAVTLSFVVYRLEGVPRSLPILQAIVAAFLLIGGRALFRLRHAGRQRATATLPTNSLANGAPENVLVVGLNRVTELYLQSVAEFASGRLKVIGLLGRTKRHTGRLVLQHPILGTPEQVANVVQDLEIHGVFVDRVVVTVDFARLSAQAQAALLALERTSGRTLDLFGERMNFDGGERRELGRLSQPVSIAGERPAFAFAIDERDALVRRPYWRLKRILDVVGASVLLVALLPAALLVALLVAVDVGLPATFWQQRPGRDGRPFKLYKFRTMAAAHDAQGRRLADEDRLSAIGRFLRRTRLDELPQLCNILSGEMSFVGPRPLLPVDQPSAYSARLLVRPGLTGWAQVKGGRAISSADKAALDVWYVRNASLALDLEILIRTLPMVLFGERVNVAAIRNAWQDLQRAGICGPHAVSETQAVPSHQAGSVST